MGLDIRIKLTPYLKIKEIKNIDIPKVKRICPNHTLSKMGDNKFCPQCGTEVINHSYTENEKLEPWKVLSDAGVPEDHLCTVDYLEGILHPNHYPPMDVRIEEEKPGVVDLTNCAELRETQIQWFESKYEQHIMALKTAYGIENIEICWGLLHYWS